MYSDHLNHHGEDGTSQRRAERNTRDSAEIDIQHVRREVQQNLHRIERT